jgi:membrane protein implicated in regulation of membrane protease activity
MGITIAIVQWQQTGLWITMLALVIIYAALLLLAILRAVKFLEQETGGRENQKSSELEQDSC